MDAILCLQNEPLHFSEKQQRDEMKLHRHIMREKFFSKILSMHSSSQSSANYLGSWTDSVCLLAVYHDASCATIEEISFL